MDEYIKREDAIKHLRGACIAKYPLSFSYGIFASANEIVKMPTADVAPKIEVAREIFEEIEFDIANLDFDREESRAIAIEGVIAALKKKYTEEKT